MGTTGAPKTISGRGHGHQHKVLAHVHEEEGFAEGIERRRDGHEKGQNPTQEGCQPPLRKSLGPRLSDLAPAAEIDEGGDRESRGYGPGDVPSRHQGIGIHGYLLPLTGGGDGFASISFVDAFAAGGSLAGCSVSRKLTSASISGGDRFFP